MLDGFVYAVGGWEGTSRLASVERYNSETNTWHSIPNLRMAVTSPAVVTHEGNYFFVVVLIIILLSFILLIEQHEFDGISLFLRLFICLWGCDFGGWGRN